MVVWDADGGEKGVFVDVARSGKTVLNIGIGDGDFGVFFGENLSEFVVPEDAVFDFDVAFGIGEQAAGAGLVAIGVGVEPVMGDGTIKNGGN